MTANKHRVSFGGYENVLKLHSDDSVTKCKFLCLMHSEAKQTKTLEFEAEKVLLQDEAGRMGGSCSKNANSLMFCLGCLSPMFFGDKFL